MTLAAAMLVRPKKYILLALLFMICYGCTPRFPVQDGFENNRLSKLWDTSRFEKQDIKIQSVVTHSGHGAVAITLHTGDKYEAGNDSSLVSERAELMEARSLVSKEGNSYEYAFSMFIPDNFPIVPTRLVLAQWKQYCEKEQCSDDSPVLALRYASGILQITIQIGPHRKVFYETHDDLRNNWTSFRFQTRFSRTRNGYVNGWINGKQVLNYKGQSCYGAERGYEPGSHFYFKMGLYRDRMPQPMTIYIDDYSKKQL